MLSVSARADDTTAIADLSDLDVPVSASQVLELPQSCAPDGGAYSCDDSTTRQDDSSADPNAVTAGQAPASDQSPDATASPSDPDDETAAISPEVGTIEDYENQGIVEDPVIISSVPAGYLQPPPSMVTPPVVGSIASAPLYPSSVPLTAAWAHPVGMTFIRPASGAPSLISSRGMPISPRPFFHR